MVPKMPQISLRIRAVSSLLRCQIEICILTYPNAQVDLNLICDSFGLAWSWTIDKIMGSSALEQQRQTGFFWILRWPDILTCCRFHTISVKVDSFFDFLFALIHANLCWKCITKTCLYNFDPFKHHFYTVKLGFTGVYIIFLILLKHRLWVLVRTALPWRF